MVYLWGFFLIKIAAGVAYGYFHAQRGGGDTWMYHAYGVEEMDLLLNDPAGFVTGLFHPGYSTGYGDFFGTSNSWWNDLDGRVFAKMLALLNLISSSNYYVNSLFFNLFSFTGTLLLVQVWQDKVLVKNPLVTLLPFLVPSFIFWSSGIHKENLLALALGLIIHPLYFGLQQQKATLRRVVALTTGLLIVLLLRNYLLLPLGMSLLAWVLAKSLQNRLHPLVTFITLFLLGAVLFFSVRLLVPSLDFPQVVVNRQQAFGGLRSPNRFRSMDLEPNATSFLQNAPQAFYNAAFRPMVWEANNALALAAACETLLILMLCAYYLRLLYTSKWRDPFLLFCLFFSVSALVIIGYTVVFPGAIVRYRSLVMPLFLMPFLARAAGNSKQAFIEN
jgi:hypothetical protein